ncbi:MAG TPA: FemAB family XrtA/PEP-CTERM system-associated protein [Allosphingosinicella sp.]|nr:FemAB family XrtA/PEP-CTERM system-associated protein [Allosphingosinicella sp.]
MNAPAPRLGIAVRKADLAAEAERIDTFVAEHPEGTIFHRPQWSRTVERGCGQRAHCLIAERGGVLIGLLPLTEVRSPLFGNALVSAGFGTGGGILGDGAQALAEAAWALGSPSVELRGGPVPQGWEATTGVYANFSRDLPGDAEALLAEIPKRQRAEVKKGLSASLATSTGSDRRHRDAHFRVYSESVRNLGTPVFPRGLFEAALDEFGDEADVAVAWQDGRPLSALLNFYFKGAVQPYWGGGTAAARKARANDLVQFDVMRRAIARGCVRADFGRSKIGTGPWSRKRIWGFDETPLTYAARGEQRDMNPLNPKYRLQIAAWQRLPLWAANRIGPLVSRGLG